MSKFIMMVGLPASGKSTYAVQLAKEENAIVLSSDKIRQDILGDVSDQKHNNEVFDKMLNKSIEALKNNQNVVYDACNINYKRRKQLLEKLKNIQCEKTCWFILTSYEDCLEYNSKRDRIVPESVIKNMYLDFYIPQYYEGWDNIQVYHRENPSKYNCIELFQKINTISQDNPYHTLTIGKHCNKCFEICKTLTDDTALWDAALFHDIGKDFTKVFHNYKGEPTNIAHYYGHQNVSAYMAYLYISGIGSYNKDQILERCKYIQWHMQPFFMNTEKIKE